MKKIQLTDGLPSSIRSQEQSEVVISLTETIKQACKDEKETIDIFHTNDF